MKKVIAIDIGGTKTAGAVVDENATILKELRVPTNPKLGPDILISTLCSIVEELIKEYEISAIGIGSAGRVNINDGSIFFASDNIPGWTGVKLQEIIYKKFNIPVIVENDCKVTGLGEEWKGAAQGLNSYVCLALGTGIGAAVKCEGRLLHGKHYSAGELGHIVLHPGGRQCNCGLKGCFEQYCSGPSLVRIYNEEADISINSGYEFFDLVRSNNITALKVLDDFVDNMYNAILTITNTYDPEKIIIGGGLIDTKDLWWDKLLSKIKESSLNQLFEIQVVPATLGSKAAVYGAAYIALFGIN